MTGMNEAGSEPTKSIESVIAVLRVALVLLVVAAIVATLLDTASRATINPFNFFGYFTMQSNIIGAVVLFLAALATLRRRPQTSLLVLSRACATTYIVIVGIVYNALLSGQEGGISLPWANWVLHVAFPIYAALDWILFGDRTTVPWRRLWIVLVYPVVWSIVVLIRGATDGWVPYPFLDPAQGYGVVALYALGIFVTIGIVGVAVFALSRLRLIQP